MAIVVIARRFQAPPLPAPPWHMQDPKAAAVWKWPGTVIIRPQATELSAAHQKMAPIRLWQIFRKIKRSNIQTKQFPPEKHITM